MSSIAAIVCGHTLERWHDIHQALESLRRQTRLPDEIVFVVDNNPELFVAASEAFSEFAIVTHNIGTRGVSPARNTAAHACNSEILAYLDDDAEADPMWIAHLLHWYEDAEVVGVGGTAIPRWDGDLIDEANPEANAQAKSGPSWFPPSFNWVVGCSHSGIADRPAPVRNFIGCNMSIRRSAWEAVGGFYDGLGRVGSNGGGGDETDFCIRVTEQVGGLIMNEPAAVVAHRVPRSRQNLKYFVRRCFAEGQSKAAITRRAGSALALAEERKHLTRELPRSFLAGIGDAMRGDLAGVARSAAIVAGTGATAVGYLQRRLQPSTDPAPVGAGAIHADDTYVPTKVLSLDLDLDCEAPEFAADPAQPLFVVVRRGAAVVGTERRTSNPGSTALSTELRIAYANTSPLVDPLPAPAKPARTAAVVIATRDRTEQLRRCLDSLPTMSRPPDQIIVVDNAPSDAKTRAMIEDWNATSKAAHCPTIEYVLCARPGLATAHNAALPEVRCEVVAFTDDDVLVDRHWLEQLCAGFDADDTVVCVTGGIMPAELETWAQDWVESSSRFNKGFAPQLFSSSRPPADPLFPFTAGSMGSGANMAFRTDWLVARGGFNEALGAGTIAMGGDDLRAFYDVINDDKAVYFTPHAVVFHHHHRTPEAIERQSYGYGSGLTAFATSVVHDDPAALFAMVRRAPRAFAHLRSLGASSDATRFPRDRERTRRHRRGLLAGPVRYARGRRQAS